MSSLPGEIWILLAGVMLLGVRVMLTGRRKRWRALRRLARDRKWTATRRDRGKLPVRYRQLELMRHGYNRRATDILVSQGSYPVRAFCYHYETGFGKRHASHDLTVAVAEADTEADRPGLCVGRRCDIEAVGPFRRYRPVESEGPSDEEIELPAGSDGGDDSAGTDDVDALSVYAESADWVGTSLGPDVRRMIASWDSACECQVRGPYVAVSRLGIVGAESQVELVSLARRLAESFEKQKAEDSRQ